MGGIAQWLLESPKTTNSTNSIKEKDEHAIK
jgi:hypothetical protein